MPVDYLSEDYWSKADKKSGRSKTTRRSAKTRRKSSRRKSKRYDPDTLDPVSISPDDPDYEDTLTATQMRAEKRRRAKEQHQPSRRRSQSPGDESFADRLGESILKEAKSEAKKLWSSERSRRKTAKEIKTIGTAIGSAASSALPKVLKGVGLVTTVGGAAGAFGVGAYYGNKNRKRAEEDYIKAQLGKYTWTNAQQFELVKEFLRKQYRDQEANAAQRRYRIK